MFNDLCYPKLYVPWNGERVELTTCPINMLLGVDDWRVCKLGSSPNAMYAAYDTRADAPNKFWARASRKAKASAACVWRGDIVFFKWHGSVCLPPDQLLSELVKYLSARYNHGAKYHFSVWK